MPVNPSNRPNRASLRRWLSVRVLRTAGEAIEQGSKCTKSAGVRARAFVGEKSVCDSKLLGFAPEGNNILRGAA